MIKPRIIGGAVLVVLLALGLGYFGAVHESAAAPQEMYRYYQRHFYEETGTQNAVVAILLTYRMYDTIFEAVILLCSVIGIMHFLPSGSKNGEKNSGRGQP